MSWGRRGHAVELGVELELRIKQKQKTDDINSRGKEKLSKKGKVILILRALFMQYHHDVNHGPRSEQNDTGGQEVLM